MVSIWLKLFSISLLLCFNCFANPTLDQETEVICVSIHKQYALQHPLMKNHRIQTKPSRELLSMLSTTSNDVTITETILKGLQECPEGLVPIYKPKTNLTNNHFDPQQFTKPGSLVKQIHKKKRKNKPISRRHRQRNHQPRMFTEIKLRYAIVRTFENTTKRWRGAQALFDINKPRLLRNQFSKAWIWLNYIHGNSMTSIQFGWAVHTSLYRDNRPRLTTLWMSDEQPKGCYNGLCRRGYIQIHRSIYPGLVYDHVTVPGGKQTTLHLSVAEDPVTKNWVLTIGTTLIGYWAGQTQLAQGAAEVYFGGFTGIIGWPSQQTISPPMGTGEFPTKDISRSCFMKQLKYVLSDYTLVDINSNEVETYVDSPQCYGVMFLKYLDSYSRETLTIGGPGGQQC